MLRSLTRGHDMKIYYSQDTSPVNSIARRRTPAVVPPFSFVGQLETGVSPQWVPPYNFYITGGYVTAASNGLSTAGFALLKVEPAFVDTPAVTLASFTLSPTDSKVAFDISEALITPYDALYVASFADSGHEGVCVQFIGEKV